MSERAATSKDKQPYKLTPRLGLILALFFYVTVALAISHVTPFNKGPDEGINLDYITFILREGHLPRTYEEREVVGPKGNWPALYHLMLAGASKLLAVDATALPQIKIFWNSFRYRALDIETDSTWYLLTEDQNWPYYNSILILHVGRWLSILCSTLTLLFAYLITIEICPQRPWLAVGVVAVLGFIPTYIFIGAVLNEDALVAALATFYFWMLVRAIKYPQQMRSYWLMGLAMGLSVTAKYTTVILPLEVVLVIALIARQGGFGWLWWLKRVTVVGLSSVLASAWWFGWNFWFLNEVDDLGLVGGLLRPLLTGGTDVTMARLGSIFTGGQIGLAELPTDVQAGTFPEWIRKTFFSFWGFNIGDTVPLHPYSFFGVGLLIVVTLWGLWRCWQRDTAARSWLMLFILHITIFFIAPLIRFGLSRRLGQTAQGRHILIPAAAAVGILLVWGIVTATPRRWRLPTVAVVIVGLLAWTGVHLVQLATFEAPPLPFRTVAQAAAWLPDEANVQFDETIALVSYQLEVRPGQGELALDLAWQSLAYVNESYLLQITVLNQTEQIVTHWTGYNGQGRVPTLGWDPGDVIFDRILLPLPNLPAGQYPVQIQILGHNGPLQITAWAAERAEAVTWQDTVLSLTDVVLSEPTQLPLSKTVAITGEQLVGPIPFELQLWRTDGRSDEQPLYRYPATISVVTSRSDVVVALIDESGQVWPSLRHEGQVHTFVIGPRWSSGLYRMQITLLENEQVVGQTTTDPLLTVENWWQRQFTVTEIPVPFEANFADQIHFLGYDLPQGQVQAGQAFPITLYWQAPPDRAPQAEFIQFNNLLDGAGTVRGGYDRYPLEYYNTLLWAPGEIVVDGYAVAVEADAPPGNYYLDVGYYIMVGESAVNLPLVVDGQMTEISSVRIGPITVVKP